jgi:hypothetical protein
LTKKILIKLSEIVEIFKKLKWKGLLGHPVFNSLEKINKNFSEGEKNI